MKLKPLAFALASGILAAFFMLVTTYYPALTGNISAVGRHGAMIRSMMVDVYPIYQVGTWYLELAGVVLGFIDGFLGGLVFAWLYNVIAEKLK